jgi:hypothetical protein
MPFLLCVAKRLLQTENEKSKKVKFFAYSLLLTNSDILSARLPPFSSVQRFVKTGFYLTSLILNFLANFLFYNGNRQVWETPQPSNLQKVFAACMYI